MIARKEEWKVGLEVVIVNTDDPELSRITTVGTKAKVVNIIEEDLDEFYHHYDSNIKEILNTPILIKTKDDIFSAKPTELSIVTKNKLIPEGLPNII